MLSTSELHRPAIIVSSLRTAPRATWRVSDFICMINTESSSRMRNGICSSIGMRQIRSHLGSLSGTDGWRLFRRIAIRMLVALRRMRVGLVLGTPASNSILTIVLVPSEERNRQAAERSEDSANSRPFIPKGVYPRRSIQVAGGSWAGHGGSPVAGTIGPGAGWIATIETRAPCRLPPLPASRRAVRAPSSVSLEPELPRS